MRVNFVEVWRRLRQASPSLRRPMATVYELAPRGIRARQIFCHQRPDRRSAGTFTAVLIHRRGQIRRRGRCFWSMGVLSGSGQTRRFDPQPVTSGLPRSTDIVRPARLVPFVPILLQKSFWGSERKFLEPLMRFARGDVRGPYRWIQNRSRISVGALKSDATAERSKDQLSRDF